MPDAAEPDSDPSGSDDDDDGVSTSSSVHSSQYVSLSELEEDRPRRCGRAGPCGERAEPELPWEKRPVYNEDGAFVGWLVWDEQAKQLDAQCGCALHKARGQQLKCHIHMVLAKRPIGYLVAWLLVGHRHLARDAHFECRLQRGDGDACGFAARERALRIAKAQPQLQLFFNLQDPIPRRGGDGEEPMHF